MLFNSFIFIFVFLPLCALGYFQLNRWRLTQAAKAWLVLASLFFYSYWSLVNSHGVWKIVYPAMIVGSMLFNYAVGLLLSKRTRPGERLARSSLAIGIVVNLAALGFFKYADFFILNLNWAAGTKLPLLHLVLPLAISFFTFQQIAYLVDSYRHETREYDFFNYCLFVTFFPQLIAGPIVHHGEMMPQFASLRNQVVDWRHVFAGLFLFAVGLLKKVVVADTFAVWATAGFDQAPTLNLFAAWATSLSYHLQLYFDFSGYTDMAMGAALVFNIKLPLNFNSPYKAVSIQDFWRRWHMTLSRWLRDYLYIPLGGSRGGETKTCLNLFIVFLVGGFWHGAGWTFVVWGMLHGLASAAHRLWQTSGRKLPAWLGWLITSLFVNLTWVFFRAHSFGDAIKVLRGMAGLDGVVIPLKRLTFLHFLEDYGATIGRVYADIGGRAETTRLIILFLLIAFLAPNSMQLKDKVKPSWPWAVLIGAMLAFGVLSMNKVSEFLYFQF
jgi:alginate O-acetyltransferase complex protein AlgI